MKEFSATHGMIGVALWLLAGSAQAHGSYPVVRDGGTTRGLYGYLAYPDGMTGFKFDYSSGDHHVSRMANGYGFSPSPWGELLLAQIAYRDNCGQDLFAWQYAHRPLPDGTMSYHASGTAKGFARTLVKSWQYGYEPVILGFNYAFTNGDHHLEGVSVELRNMGGEVWLETGYWDNDGADPYTYDVTYGLVPVTQLHLPGSYYVQHADGSAYGYAAVPIATTYPVLQSFSLEFTNGDHHVDEVGVDLAPSQLRVWFNDSNDDDPFYWSVDYVDLDP